MLAPHPDGAKVHRGYSWPGLEKVSQVMNGDEMKAGELRKVRDCKVCLAVIPYLFLCMHARIYLSTDNITNRKATKSAANIT